MLILHFVGLRRTSAHILALALLAAIAARRPASSVATSALPFLLGRSSDSPPRFTTGLAEARGGGRWLLGSLSQLLEVAELLPHT